MKRSISSRNLWCTLAVTLLLTSAFAGNVFAGTWDQPAYKLTLTNITFYQDPILGTISQYNYLLTWTPDPNIDGQNGLSHVDIDVCDDYIIVPQYTTPGYLLGDGSAIQPPKSDEHGDHFQGCGVTWITNDGGGVKFPSGTLTWLDGFHATFNLAVTTATGQALGAASVNWVAFAGGNCSNGNPDGTVLGPSCSATKCRRGSRGCGGFGELCDENFAVGITASSAVCLTSSGNSASAAKTDSGDTDMTGATYDWSATTGATITGSGASVTFAPTSNSVTLRVTVTTEAGCEASSSKTVTIDAPPTLSLTGDHVCVNNEATVTASFSGGTIVWSGPNGTQNGGTTYKFTPTSAGSATVSATVTGNTSCTNTVSDSTSVIVDPLPVLGISVSPDQHSYCVGTNVTLTATGSNFTNVQWSSSPAGTVNQDGSYTVSLTTAGYIDVTATATSTNLCAAPAAAQTRVTFDAPSTAALTGGGSYCYGAKVKLTASGNNIGTVFEWYFGDALISGATSSTYEFIASSTNAGSYSVQAFSTNACGNPEKQTVTVSTKECMACTLTQGAWGSFGGAGGAGQIRAYLPGFIGGGKTVTMTQSGSGATVADCVMAALPAGGSPAALATSTSITYTGGPTLSVSNCKYGNLPMKNGKFQNVLLGQTLTLAINVNWSVNQGGPIGPVTLSTSFCTAAKLPNGEIDTNPLNYRSVSIPQSVINVAPTVQDLLNLANAALGGANTGVSLSDINAALNAVNVGFDGCRVKVNCQ